MNTPLLARPSGEVERDSVARRLLLARRPDLEHRRDELAGTSDHRIISQRLAMLLEASNLLGLTFVFLLLVVILFLVLTLLVVRVP